MRSMLAGGRDRSLLIPILLFFLCGSQDSLAQGELPEEVPALGEELLLDPVLHVARGEARRSRLLLVGQLLPEASSTRARLERTLTITRQEISEHHDTPTPTMTEAPLLT